MPLHRIGARRLWRASQGGRVRARARCCGPRRIRNEQRGAATFVALASVDRGQLVVFHRRPIQVVRDVLQHARAAEDLERGRARAEARARRKRKRRRGARRARARARGRSCVGAASPSCVGTSTAGRGLDGSSKRRASAAGCVGCARGSARVRTSLPIATRATRKFSSSVGGKCDGSLRMQGARDHRKPLRPGASNSVTPGSTRLQTCRCTREARRRVVRARLNLVAASAGAIVAQEMKRDGCSRSGACAI